jgi:hypothetical protein
LHSFQSPVATKGWFSLCYSMLAAVNSERNVVIQQLVLRSADVLC